MLGCNDDNDSSTNPTNDDSSNPANATVAAQDLTGLVFEGPIIDGIQTYISLTEDAYQVYGYIDTLECYVTESVALKSIRDNDYAFMESPLSEENKITTTEALEDLNFLLNDALSEDIMPFEYYDIYAFRLESGNLIQIPRGIYINNEIRRYRSEVDSKVTFTASSARLEPVCDVSNQQSFPIMRETLQPHKAINTYF